jgi:putative endonuclease
MATERRKTGDIGERLAVEFLQRKGFTVVERNYRRPWGEIDIIAEKDGEVRFVEVKAVSRDTSNGVTREISGYSPEEMAHGTKLSKVARTAELYMDSKGDTRDFQVDVVTVVLDKTSRKAHCRLYEQVL